MATISKEPQDHARSEAVSVSRGTDNRYFTNFDLVVIAMLAAVGNIISVSLDYFKFVFPKTGPPFFQLFGGYHLIWMVLAFGITRKQGSPTFVAAIKGIFEFMSWDAFFGPWVIALSLVEGVGIDVGFYLFKRLRSERARCIIAGALGNLFQPVVSYSIVLYYIGKPLPTIPILLAAMAFAVVSGALIAGLLGFELVRVVKRKDVQAFIKSG
ncbi:MAG: ECF transporter S component [Candidatus Lokiarchaeota archaeon]|nr:ECF transporter S component [Candidatus Lokiarchaeota archaeon]